ncbi:5-oxoprolinase subunit PxpA [Vibrio sp. CAU 1672]|uniref:5-oxoprolinase subunit PxpA n=1 Tax=Vibrio sp. CAU 1672 TaxID=3032594 RepID=UPI0023DCC03F|nr:5-oxoprolinase subunit PxpA [Vibrio sp. CAU 1672]MDF2154786.1 LamB/YcsF family protein [Vibrio sp. CAU 1672]
MTLNKQQLTLNCDMGESFGAWTMGTDELVMPHVDMANIACGFHASDPNVMHDTIALANQYDVEIGAHPGYPDLLGFGRRSLSMTGDDITNMLIYQVGALQAMCKAQHTDLSYVKPHGALYNDMLRDDMIFRAIVKGVAMFKVPLMILASQENDKYLDMADDDDVPLLFEAFADRLYQDNGMLTPRSQGNAVLTSEHAILEQVRMLSDSGRVKTASGGYILLEADTICVHGDNAEAISLIQKIRHSIYTGGR